MQVTSIAPKDPKEFLFVSFYILLGRSVKDIYLLFNYFSNNNNAIEFAVKLFILQ